MNRRSVFYRTSLLFGALELSAGTAFGQSAKDIVGSYTIVAVTNVKGDKKVEPYGPDPRGMMMLDANGRYLVALMEPGLPKFASNDRSTGTADENKAIVLGTFTHFGTYSVAGGAIIFRLESSSFPNWDGQEQKRALTVSGDELKYEVASSTGGTTTVVWKRAR